MQKTLGGQVAFYARIKFACYKNHLLLNGYNENWDQTFFVTEETIMTDMLVKLYALPDVDPNFPFLKKMGIMIRRPMAYERRLVVAWVKDNFNMLWAAECETAFSRHPFDCYIAVESDVVIGFCCVNCTFPNFLGPIGVHEKYRSTRVGSALLLSALYDLKFRGGYAYAIIGDAGQPDFFKKVAGATEIADSTPGPYPNRLSQ